MLSEREIQSYIDTGEPMDKAGAYGAQDWPPLFVEGIDGDLFNVMVCWCARWARCSGNRSRTDLKSISGKREKIGRDSAGRSAANRA